MPVSRPAEGETLSARTSTLLKRRQTKANSYLEGSAAIGGAWKAFGGTDAKKEVAEKLEKVFFGKCAYCEITVARDVEHYYPKSLYPQRMFRWDNFLFACKNCNTDKSNRFPMSGNAPLLLDPCSDEPADFITWDLLDSGQPILPPDRRLAETLAFLPQLRAQSLATLRLQAARNFKWLLTEVLEPMPRPSDALTWLESELDPRQQWMSVRRQILRDPDWQPVVAKVRTQYPYLGPKIDSIVDPRSVP